MSKIITAADLFCGAGGTSTGLASACKKMGYALDLVAVNHWDVAISTHAKNHPYARHINAPIDSIKPQDVFPGGRLNLLVASPECTHFSNARGGRPMSDQRRASGFDILPWLEKLYVDNVLIENVKEFRTWGPLGANGRPLKSKKGATYDMFLKMIESLGYRVEDKVLNAANYGAPTTRERLFIIARRGNKKINWPTPTHLPASELQKRELQQQEGFFNDEDEVQQWRSARDIIDWTIEGKSIFNRKKPLAPATLRRIAAGLKKFGGAAAEPFLIILRQHAEAMSVDEPVTTITAGRLHHGLVEPLIEPFIIGQQSGAVARSVDDPVPTVATQGAISLVQPFIVPQFKENGPKSVDEPLGTLTTTSRGVGLCEPFLVPFYSENGDQQPRSHSIDEPMPTVPTKAVHGLVEPYLVEVGGPAGKSRNPRSVDEPMQTIIGQNHTALVEPYLVNLSHMGEGELGHERRVYSQDQPMPTITGRGQFGVVEPVVMAIDHGSSDGNPRPVSEPLHTVTTKERLGVVEPIITPYYGNGEGSSVEDPLPTVTTKDRFALVEPYLIQFNNNSKVSSLEEPLPTILTREKLALITPDGTQYGLDIRFRMLQPHELSAAMSFPHDYEYEGNRESVVKQIGNAVCPDLAEQIFIQSFFKEAA